MIAKLVVADDNQVYWVVMDADGEVHIVSLQDTSARVGGEVAVLNVWRG